MSKYSQDRLPAKTLLIGGKLDSIRGAAANHWSPEAQPANPFASEGKELEVSAFEVGVVLTA
ncbi:hypothetical protein EBZ37_13810 [bacterium]|nr:hypothetical protein [bacterium]